MPEEPSLGNPLAVPNEATPEVIHRHPEDTLLREAAIGIVGDEDVVSGFRALGFRAYSVTKGEEFKTIFDQLLKNKTAICLVEEDIYLAAQQEINNHNQLPFPIFIPFSKTGRMNLLDDIVKKIRLKATGVV